MILNVDMNEKLSVRMRIKHSKVKESPEAGPRKRMEPSHFPMVSSQQLIDDRDVQNL